MPGFNPERINIKNLTIEEPEQKREVSFDFDKEIKPEYWKKYLDWFDELRIEKYRDNFAFMKNLTILKILGREMNLSKEEENIVRAVPLPPKSDSSDYELRRFELVKVLGGNPALPDKIARKVSDQINYSINERNIRIYIGDIRSLALEGKRDLISERTKDL